MYSEEIIQFNSALAKPLPSFLLSYFFPLPTFQSNYDKHWLANNLSGSETRFWKLELSQESSKYGYPRFLIV